MEINDSTDQTLSVLMERIFQSMESNSFILHKYSRPICLLLDEFDGIHNNPSTVKKTTDLIQSELPLFADVTVANNVKRRRLQGSNGAQKNYTGKLRCWEMDKNPNKIGDWDSIYVSKKVTGTQFTSSITNSLF